METPLKQGEDVIKFEYGVHMCPTMPCLGNLWSCAGAMACLIGGSPAAYILGFPTDALC